MVSETSLEVVFCNFNVCFSGAVVLVCVLLSAVAKKKKKNLQLPTEEPTQRNSKLLPIISNLLRLRGKCGEKRRELVHMKFHECGFETNTSNKDFFMKNRIDQHQCAYLMLVKMMGSGYLRV